MRLLFLLLGIMILFAGCIDLEGEATPQDNEPATGNGTPVTGNTTQETENATPTTGNGKPITGNTSPATVNATYYVGKSNCGDTGSGTQSAPFCTVQKGMDSVKAGQILLILPGTYSERVEVKNSGTKNAPIIISGVSANSVIIDGGCTPLCERSKFEDVEQDETILIHNKNYIFLSNLTVRNAPSYGISAESTNGVTIENVKTINTAMSGISVYDSANFQIKNNSVTKANTGWKGFLGSLEVGPEEAVTIVNSSDFEIAYNHVYDTYKEGIDVKVYSKNGSVHHNNVERACSVGIYINEVFDIDVYQNNISSAGYFNSGGRILPCSSLPTYGSYYGKWFGSGILLAVGDIGELSKGKLSNIDIYQNKVTNANLNCLETWDELRESGTGAGEMTGIRIHNNVFTDCGNNGIGSGIRLDSTYDAEVFNNTISDYAEAGITGDGVSSSKVFNNSIN